MRAKYIVVRVAVDPVLYNAMKIYARYKRMALSEIGRRAIEKYLKGEEEE